MALSTRRKVVLTVAVFIAGAACLGLWLQKDPFAERYKGRSVKEWIEFYAEQEVLDPELEVVQHFGSAALPGLVPGIRPTDIIVILFKAVRNRVTGSAGPVSVDWSDEESRKFMVGRNWCKLVLRHQPDVVGEALSLSINERVQLFSAFADVEHPTNLVARFLTNSNPLIASNAAEVATIFATVPSPTKPFAPPTAQSGSGVE